MSTQPDDLAPPPADDGAPPPNPDPAPSDPPEAPPEDASPETIDDIARRVGWVPKEEFHGDPNDWKPADRFIIDGRDIQRDTAQRLKTVQQQLDTLAKTSASIVEQQVNERVEALRTQHAEAVEAGDAGAALKISQQIDRTLETAKPANGPSPDAQAFAERNAAWFQKPGNEYATARAIEICNTLAAQGYTDHGTQLRIAEQRLRQEMPQLFKADINGKPPAGVNAPGNRAPVNGGNRQKGFADMPKEAQDIARDMVERKVIPSAEAYVKNYFANEAGKA